jgi:hypothetical protein
LDIKTVQFSYGNSKGYKWVMSRKKENGIGKSEMLDGGI